MSLESFCEAVDQSVTREDPPKPRHRLLNPVTTSCFGFHQLPLSLWFLGGGVEEDNQLETKEEDKSLEGAALPDKDICIL